MAKNQINWEPDIRIGLDTANKFQTIKLDALQGLKPKPGVTVSLLQAFGEFGGIVNNINTSKSSS